MFPNHKHLWALLFDRPKVKADGSTLIGRHDDSILGLDFQGAAALAGQQNCDGYLDRTTVDVTTAERQLDGEKLVVKQKNGGGTSVTKSSQKRVEQRFSAQDGHSGAGGVGRDDGSDKEATEDDGEDEVSFGLVVLSASMDGTISAWEMLGKSEKYRMRQPAGVEVTSMLVLTGGSVLVTGESTLERRLLARVFEALWWLKNPRLIPCAYF